MAKVLVTESSLEDIADAIRGKNGQQTTYKPGEMAAAIGAIPTPTGTKQITANGTGIDVAQYASADVAVPNSYSASDEGKVVSNGALVAQGSSSTTINGTFDTTLINSFLVNVSGGGSSGLEYESGTWNPAADTNRGEISFTNQHTKPPVMLMLADVTNDGTTPDNAVFVFCYMDSYRAWGTSYLGSGVGGYGCVFTYSKATSNPQINGTSFTQNSDVTTDNHPTYPRWWVSYDKFHPTYGNNATRLFYAGRTYKWYAVWMPGT